MSEPESASEALRWLRYARDDLDVAGQMAQETGRARYTCWFSQQATEKALKALLVLEGIDFPFTHDLESLLELHDEWPQRTTRADLEQLTEWGAESRYPGDWPELTAEDGARAQAEARTVYDSIVAEFGRRGIAVE